jgi:hypothetical protein
MNPTLQRKVVRFVLAGCLASLLFLGSGATRAGDLNMVGTADAAGFVPIFNGKDLSGWDGDTRLWSVRDGIIRGETTSEKVAPHNTFLIWRGGQPRDFVLKLKFHIHSGNSGVQYRSKDMGDWIVSGYQGEIANDRPDPGIGTGFLYHERGRGDIARIGEFAVIDATGKRTVVGRVGDMNALKAAGYYKNDDWNEYTIMAHGNHLIHLVNGYQTIEMIDNDRKGGARQGIIALQIHAGEPMLVEFKDMRLKLLDADLPVEGRKFNSGGHIGWVTAPEGEK